MHCQAIWVVLLSKILLHVKLLVTLLDSFVAIDQLLLHGREVKILPYLCLIAELMLRNVKSVVLLTLLLEQIFFELCLKDSLLINEFLHLTQLQLQLFFCQLLIAIGLIFHQLLLLCL